MYKPEVSPKEKADKKALESTELEFLSDLRVKVNNDVDDRSSWEEKLLIASNQRLGIKRVSNYPYENAPDIPLPETDKLIKKSTPNLILSAWSPKIMCTVRVEDGIQTTPELEDKAKKAELALNMLLRNKMNFFHKLELAADYAKEKGSCIFKTVEEFKTRTIHKVIDLKQWEEQDIEQLRELSNDELMDFVYSRYPELDPEDDKDKEICKKIVEDFRAGEEIIEFDIEEVTSLPNIEVPSPARVIVPSYTTEIDYSNRITEEFYLTRREIEERIEEGIYLEKDMDEIIKSEPGDDYYEDRKKSMRGMADTTSQDDLYKIRETRCWKKEGDCYQRMVFTYFADVGDEKDALLRKIAFPHEFETWDYDKFDNEIKGDNYYESRGMPEQVRALQEVLERSVNNMLIRDEYNNNPVYEVLDTSELLTRNSTWAPGELLPVSELGKETRRIDEKGLPDVSSERIMQIIKAYAEEYVGNVDQLFRNATNRGGANTLGEIREGISQSAGLVDVEIIRWNETLSKVYRKLFDIMQDRMGGDIWVDGVRITKEDFNFPACVKANGSLEMADKKLATAKAWTRLQAAMQMVQAGVANQEDLYNSYKDWLEKDGVKDADLFSTDPKEMMQGQFAQMQKQIKQMTEQAQMLAEAISKGEQEVAKLKEDARQEINEFKGKMESLKGGGK